MNKPTIKDLRASIAKGFGMLTEDTKNALSLAITAYIEAQGRTRGTLKHVHYEHILDMTRKAYVAQRAYLLEQAAESSFDWKTASFTEKARYRAAQIKNAMDAAKAKAAESGKTIKVTLPKISWQ